MFKRHQREWSVAAVFGALLLIVAAVAPDFYRAGNLRDLVVGNAPVLIVAAGMTLVILTGHIDISVGAQFAVASVATGWLAKWNLPWPLIVVGVAACGACAGGLNGLLVARLKIPSIVVTLATMVALRDALRWATEGAWVRELPANFQWLGLGQTLGQWSIALAAVAVLALCAWALKNLAWGRALYAVGSDEEAARLAGLRPTLIVGAVFVSMGVLTGVAALLNSVRFIDVPGNAGVGLELKVIAAAVVGGTSINGGRGTMTGTLLGVALLGTIGTALTFLGVNPFWEKAVQGAIILGSVVAEPLARIPFGRGARAAKKAAGI